jgi:N-methylhydantoinase B
LPPRGYGGGGAGSSTKLVDFEGVDVGARWDEGELPSDLNEYDWENKHTLEAKEAPHTLTDEKVVQHVVASGGGIGDPLLRDPELVAKDVSNGAISDTHAENAYGVILNEDASVDVTATEQHRAELREQRLERAEMPNEESA